jgi:hypothetical protein
MEEIDEKKLVEQARTEFDLKLKTWDFVQSVKQAVENEDWTRYGDCPYINMIPLNQIKECYERRLKDGSKRSSSSGSRCRRCWIMERSGVSGNSRGSGISGKLVWSK